MDKDIYINKKYIHKFNEFIKLLKLKYDTNLIDKYINKLNNNFNHKYRYLKLKHKFRGGNIIPNNIYNDEFNFLNEFNNDFNNQNNYDFINQINNLLYILSQYNQYNYILQHNQYINDNGLDLLFYIAEKNIDLNNINNFIDNKYIEKYKTYNEKMIINYSIINKTNVYNKYVFFINKYLDLLNININNPDINNYLNTINNNLKSILNNDEDYIIKNNNVSTNSSYNSSNNSSNGNVENSPDNSKNGIIVNSSDNSKNGIVDEFNNIKFIILYNFILSLKNGNNNKITTIQNIIKKQNYNNINENINDTILNDTILNEILQIIKKYFDANTNNEVNNYFNTYINDNFNDINISSYIILYYINNIFNINNKKKKYIVYKKILLNVFTLFNFEPSQYPYYNYFKKISDYYIEENNYLHQKYYYNIYDIMNYIKYYKLSEDNYMNLIFYFMDALYKYNKIKLKEQFNYNIDNNFMTKISNIYRDFQIKIININNYNLPYKDIYKYNIYDYKLINLTEKSYIIDDYNKNNILIYKLFIDDNIIYDKYDKTFLNIINFMFNNINQRKLMIFYYIEPKNYYIKNKSYFDIFYDNIKLLLTKLKDKNIKLNSITLFNYIENEEHMIYNNLFNNLFNKIINISTKDFKFNNNEIKYINNFYYSKINSKNDDNKPEKNMINLFYDYYFNNFFDNKKIIKYNGSSMINNIKFLLYNSIDIDNKENINIKLEISKLLIYSKNNSEYISIYNKIMEDIKNFTLDINTYDNIKDFNNIFSFNI